MHRHDPKPNTQYTKSGRINIAFQVYGSGPVDLVYIPGWVSNIDWMWACPELVSFFVELGKVCRIILFDKRGTGLSDRIVESSTMEERMDDIRAVMDAVGSEKAFLFGHSEGGSVSALFAATYPNRTIGLLAFGIFAKRRYSEDYPWAPTDEERAKVYEMIDQSWGSGEMNLASLAPSKVHDKSFMDWLANYFRSGASPSAAMVLTRMNTQVDIIHVLPSIKVPCLILQRTNDIDVKIEEGRFIADRIQGARFLELPGDDHLFWAGDAERVLKEMKTFIHHTNPIRNYEERLFTFVAGTITTSSPSATEAQIRDIISQYRGTIIHEQHDRFLATFDGPSKAVHGSIALRDRMAKAGIQVSAAIHIQETSLEDIYSGQSQAEGTLISILQMTGDGQILLSQTVKNLLSGAGLMLSYCCNLPSAGSEESFQLYHVSDPAADPHSPSSAFEHSFPRNDSFLENILQSIDSHLSEESFGVDRLCREIGISERQLQRKLKALTNRSPNQLISSVRLHRAKEMILNGTSSISEVAFATGFSSPSYFSKCFKREFGKSPRSFLRNQW